MLNRLYIAVGMLAILLIAAAFVVPSFVNWTAFRADLAAVASEVTGKPVQISGDVRFTLLPQPRLVFSGVSVGEAEKPTLSVERVEADLSLVDMLRGHYAVTQLLLDRPSAILHIRSDGSIESGLSLAPATGEGSLSISEAVITAGRLSLIDDRSGDDSAITDIQGTLKLESLEGPVSFQGSGRYDGERYASRITTGVFSATDPIPLAASVRADTSGASFTTEGNITLGDAPSYAGAMLYRQPPLRQSASGTDVGQGDFVMTAQLRATAASVLFSNYEVIPDENRTTTRLSGAASIKLGVGMSFKVVVTGGLMTLPPRDATKETGPQPYELVRLLGELPAPPVPPIDGDISVSVTQLDLRGTALRNVHLDAWAHDKVWTIDSFGGELPGGTELTLKGDLYGVADMPEFVGSLDIASKRLDALSTAWRKPAPGNPLFNLSGSLSADIRLVDRKLGFSNGRLVIDGDTETFSGIVGVGAERSLTLAGKLGSLDAARSAELFALLPDPAEDTGITASFTSGSLDLAADRLTIAGIDGQGLAAKGSWNADGITIDSLAADDFGGATLSFAGSVSGPVTRPDVIGSGSARIAQVQSPALDAAFDALGASPQVRGLLRRLLPADVTLGLNQPGDAGVQQLAVAGTIGAATLDARLDFPEGFLRGLEGQLGLDFGLKARDADTMLLQLGLGTGGLVGAVGEEAQFAGLLNGPLGGTLKGDFDFTSGTQSLAYKGTIDTRLPDLPSGKGTITAELEEASPILALFGAGGLTLPPLSGSSEVAFEGNRSIQLTRLKGQSGGKGFSGDLSLVGADGRATVAGTIWTDGFAVADLWQVLAGSDATLPPLDGVWPDGPIVIGDTPRTTVGRLEVNAGHIAIDADRDLADAHFDLAWDDANIRLRDFAATLDGGTLSADVSICCSSALAQKTLSGRASVTGVPIADLLPTTPPGLAGTLDLAGQFTAIGATAAELANTASGEGTFSIAAPQVAALDPAALGRITALDTLLDRNTEDVTAEVVAGLDAAPFVGAPTTGTFTIAGGIVRSPNFSMVGTGGRLFGSGTLRLSDLALGGSYVLNADDGGAVEASLASVTLLPTGTLLEPSRTIDASGYVDTLMAKAYEAEVERLERLQAEDEARRLAAEAEQARLAAEEKAKADEAARKAAEDAAAKKAADDAKAKAAAAERQRQQDEATKPLDLGLGQ